MIRSAEGGVKGKNGFYGEGLYYTALGRKED
jgi:hypothetical protein